MNDNESGLITKIWGPHLWKSLHCISFGYPNKPSEDQKKGCKLFFQSLAYVLPCQYCRDSYSHFITSEPTIITDEIFENRDILSKWVYKLHQRVNQKLDIDYNVSYDQIAKKYESFRIKCSGKSSQCILSSQDKSIAHLNDTLVDCPIVPMRLALNLKKYANIRGISFTNIGKYNNMANRDRIQRDIECTKIINDMKFNGISSIELEGEFFGLPTVHELELLSRLCSNLSQNELETISRKINGSRYKLIKKNN